VIERHKPEDCMGCYYNHTSCPEEGWCYMFKYIPITPCKKFKKGNHENSYK